VNSKQARTAKRIDPHVQCREDYIRVHGWLKEANVAITDKTIKIRLLKEEVRLWKISTIGLASVISIAYGLWLLQIIFN